MNIYQLRKLFEQKMSDKLSIFRRVDSVNPDGTTCVKLSNEPIYTDIPCRISFIRYKVEDPSNINVDENIVSNTPKIFLPVFTDIKAGDFVILNRMSIENEILYVYKGIVGMPATYDTHTEIMMFIDESA